MRFVHNRRKITFISMITAACLVVTGTLVSAEDVPSFSLDTTAIDFGGRLSDRTAYVKDGSGTVLATTKGVSSGGILRWSDETGASRPIYRVGSGSAGLVFSASGGTDSAGSVSYTVGAPNASSLKSAVSGLSFSDTQSINNVAAAMGNMSATEKRRVDTSTVKRLGELFNKGNFGSSDGRDSVTVSSDLGSSKTISAGNSYAYGVSASRGSKTSLAVSQESESGSALMEFRLDEFAAPVVVYLAAPSGLSFSSSNDYYVRTPGGDQDVTIVTGSPRRFSFLAPESGVYRLYRDRNASNDDDEEGEPTSFWNGVIDHIYDARAGATVRASLGSRSTVPADVLRELRGRSVTLVLRERDGSSISIYGKDMDKIPESRTYYNVSTLRTLFGTKNSSAASSDAWEDDVVITPPIPAVLPEDVLEDPGTGTVPNVTRPQITVPIPPASTLSPIPSSSLAPVPSSSEVSVPSSSFDAFEGVEEVEASSRSSSGETVSEVVAEEDSSQPEEDRETASQPIGRSSMMIFVGLAALMAACGGGLVTYLVMNRQKKRL